MEYVDTIVVGGGPAGSACAWQLQRNGHDVLILDRQSFPRVKLCAGWITSQVLQDLEVTAGDYPAGILRLNIRTHLPLLPFAIPGLPTPGLNYSVRRSEFDHWLLNRSGAPLIEHNAERIRQDGSLYVIDDRFTCRHLVGAGGTMCPVRRILFPRNRQGTSQIATLEHEFKYPERQEICHLYFCYKGLKGYAWFVPKADGFVNVGIGGKSRYFSRSGTKIHDHFRAFLTRLVREGRLDQTTVDELRYRGHPYFLASYRGEVQRDGCFLVGDSAGLATLDLGEGIGPAIESGLLAAKTIMGQATYSRVPLTKYSLGGLARQLAARLLPVRGTEAVPTNAETHRRAA